MAAYGRRVGGVYPGIEVRFGSWLKRRDTARLIRSGATSILFVLFPQKLASLSIDEMYPSASFAGDCFVLVGRRVLIAVEPMLDFHPCYWAGEQQGSHGPLIRGLILSAMI
jgi:hypothetical protein